MECGHICLLTCHPGQHSGADGCVKEVTKTCPCGRISRTYICNSKQTVQCDANCEAIKAEEVRAEAQRKLEREAALAADAAKREAALSDGSFYGMAKKPRVKRRKEVETDAEVASSWFSLDLNWILWGSMLVAVLAMLMTVYLLLIK